LRCCKYLPILTGIIPTIPISLSKEINDMRFATGLTVSVVTLAATLNLTAIASTEEAASKEAVTPPPSGTAVAAPAATGTAVVATVNGVPISRAELDRATQGLLAQTRMPAPTEPQQKQQIEAMALDMLIAQEALYQAAQSVPIPDLDKKVEEKLNAAKARFGTPEAFEKALGQTGMTVAEFKDHLTRDTLIGAYLEQEITAKITITSEQAKQYYNENLDKFKKPEAVHASHILIGVDAKATPEEKQAAKQKAEELLAKIKGGADFAEIAKAESTCPSAPKGGDLGTFGPGQMVKPFEEVVFSLQDGAVSDVVETQFGYHIIKSQGKTPSETVPFDQVQARIQAQLKNVEVKKQLGAKVETLKQAAKIEKPALAQ